MSNRIYVGHLSPHRIFADFRARFDVRVLLRALLITNLLIIGSLK